MNGREREGVLLRAGSAALARSMGEQPPLGYQPSAVERRATVRRAADQPVNGAGPSFRLGDVYAEELTRLREQAHAEGFAAGHAEGLGGAGAGGREGRGAAPNPPPRGAGRAGARAGGRGAAGAVVAGAGRAAEIRLAEVRGRWERRLASATAALSGGVTRLDEAVLPVADDIRETIVGTVLTLLEDLLGR